MWYCYKLYLRCVKKIWFWAKVCIGGGGGGVSKVWSKTKVLYFFFNASLIRISTFWVVCFLKCFFVPYIYFWNSIKFYMLPFFSSLCGMFKKKLVWTLKLALMSSLRTSIVGRVIFSNTLFIFVLPIAVRCCCNFGAFGDMFSNVVIYLRPTECLKNNVPPWLPRE